MGKSDEFRDELEEFFHRFDRQVLDLTDRCTYLEKENSELKKLVKRCVAMLSQSASLESKEHAVKVIERYQNDRNLEEKFKNNSGPSLPGNAII